jgi:hypothetical protein
MKIRSIMVALAATAISATGASAQTNVATQTVNFSIAGIARIAFTGTPTLAITTAVAGSAPTTVSDAVTATWAVTTNQTNQKITASINSDMPANTTLTVALAAPSGATSAGVKTLALAAVDVVTGITKLNQNSMVVTYSLAATSLADEVVSGSRTVTYTITPGA